MRRRRRYRWSSCACPRESFDLRRALTEEECRGPRPRRRTSSAEMFDGKGEHIADAALGPDEPRRARFCSSLRRSRSTLTSIDRSKMSSSMPSGLKKVFAGESLRRRIQERDQQRVVTVGQADRDPAGSVRVGGGGPAPSRRNGCGDDLVFLARGRSVSRRRSTARILATNSHWPMSLVTQSSAPSSRHRTQSTSSPPDPR